MTLGSTLARRLIAVTLIGGLLPTAATMALTFGSGELHAWFARHPWLYAASISALIALAALGGISASLLGRRITRALNSLSGQADAVARGDLTGRVETEGRRLGEGCRDELDRVAMAFNLMAAQVAQQIIERDRFEGEMRALNAELEARIAERTQALEGAQGQLLRVEKSAALGQLVAGIAHEINNHVNFIATAINPVEMGINDLNAVLGAWQRVADAPPEARDQAVAAAAASARDMGIDMVADELATATRQMRSGAQRIRTIVANLRTFSHTGGEQPESTDLAQLIDQTLALVRPRLGDHITVKLDLDAMDPVRCLPVQMTQVLVNLLINSADAIEGTGTITLHLSREAGEVRLTVRDTGKGIPPETLSKIFDPFFTMKDVGQGTGLGLFVCQQILEAHGGGIDVESLPGEGTEVTVHWPLKASSLRPVAVA